MAAISFSGQKVLCSSVFSGRLESRPPELESFWSLSQWAFLLKKPQCEHKWGYGLLCQWPLSGQTQITLTPAKDASLGPVINAGEVFQVLPLGGSTNIKDAVAMEDLLESIKNPPVDWSGDPCLPRANSWTGLTCSNEKITRVISLNLTNLGLSGSLPPSINKMTALKDLWLGKNKLTRQIPELSLMTRLETLHLEDNQFTGAVPETLAKLPNLRTLSLKNNKLQGTIPSVILEREGLTIRALPENMPSIKKTG